MYLINYFIGFVLITILSETSSFIIKRRNSELKKKVKYLGIVLPSTHTDVKIGAVGGLSLNDDDDLVIFHRASRVWSWDTFFGDNFNTLKYGPIAEDILYLVDSSDLEKLYSWGANKFYMPHGLTLDIDGNIWLTDVGTHQVYKYNFRTHPNETILTLGEKLVKGSDKSHFCKPTKVAISNRTRDIYVADGYCNSRIIRFDKDGNYIREYTDPDKSLQIAHSIAIIEKLNLICTVSREDGRIVCFDIDSGNKEHEITNSNMKTVYSIVYDPVNKVIHAATGSNKQEKSIGLTFSARRSSFGKLLQIWDGGNDDLSQTHDIGLSLDGTTIYLGQLNGKINSFVYA